MLSAGGKKLEQLNIRGDEMAGSLGFCSLLGKDATWSCALSVDEVV